MNFSRGSLILDCLRKYTIKDAKAVEQELTRMYNFIIPLNTTYDEVYGVLTELISDVKKMEEAEKERAEKAKAETTPAGVDEENIGNL